MSLAQGNPPPDETGVSRSDPDCELRRLDPTHVCLDRDKQPLDDRGHTCFLNAHRQAYVPRRPDVVEQAESVVRAFEARVIGGEVAS